MPRSIAMAAVLVLVAGGVRAEDAEEFIENVDAAYYAPGVDDLHCHEVWESLRDGTFKGVVVNLYWKAPDRRRCKIENPPKELGDVADSEKCELRMLENIVREPFAEKAERFTFALRDDGDLKALEGVPKEGTPEAKDMVSRWTWWFDGDLKLVKSVREDPIQKTRWEYKWKEEAGVYMLEERKEFYLAAPEFLFKTERFSYEEVGEAGLLLTKVEEERMVGGTPIKTETLIQDYEVNTGLAEDLFSGAGEK